MKISARNSKTKDNKIAANRDCEMVNVYARDAYMEGVYPRVGFSGGDCVEGADRGTSLSPQATVILSRRIDTWPAYNLHSSSLKRAWLVHRRRDTQLRCDLRRAKPSASLLT